MAILVLKDVTKGFKKVPVVRKVSLSAEEGEMLALLGPSGCGKTTTLRMIAGLETPEEGEIWIEGRLASARGKNVIEPKARHLGMVFQDLALWPHMNVQGNIEFGLKAMGMRRFRRKKRVEEVLHQLRLEGLKRFYPSNLSGGQQQLVAIARAIAPGHKMLLMDEPLSNLDVHLKEGLRMEILRLQKELKITILYVTHDQEDAFILASRIAVMQGGRIEQIDTPEAIYKHPSSEFVARFVGSSNILEVEVTAPGLVNTPFGTLECPTVGAERGKVLLLFRPQSIVLSKEAQYRARVLKRVFMGDYYKYLLYYNGLELTAHSKESFLEDEGVQFSLGEEPMVLRGRG